MRIGIFADSHDHLDNIRGAVARFNSEACECVIFAGDFVSTIAIPPLRKLHCPLIACFGDNDGNKVGLRSGISLVGTVDDAPFVFESLDGRRIAVAHMRCQLRELDFDIGIYGHTHRARIYRDERGRLYINPGELGGWSFGRPTIAVLETEFPSAKILEIVNRSGPQDVVT